MTGKNQGRGYRWLVEHVGFAGDECLIWPFGRDKKDGTGRVSYLGCAWVTHRLMCEMAKGKPPTREHEVAHSCGKGHEGCVNPKHLSWKTHAQNMKDSVLHGTSCRDGVGRLTDEQVLEVQALRGKLAQTKIAARFDVSVGCIQYWHHKLRDAQ